jgi:pimeloyl-ACP methyl ester carboxylesterase
MMKSVRLPKMAAMPRPIARARSVCLTRTAIAVCLLPATIAVAQTNQTIPSSTYTRPQRLVAVEGNRRLNLFCLGRGSPTVLFDAGAGENMMVWRHVQRQVASATRACAYDRGGYGFSDPAERASDARNVVSDLHRLLEAAALAPVVYVGHSIAGLYGALLVVTYPGDVAGAVLVDPAFPHSFELTSAAYTAAERARMSKMLTQGIAHIRDCLTLARAHTLSKPTTRAASSCIATGGYAEPLDGTLRRELERQYARPKVYAAALSEYGSLWPGAGEVLSVDDREIDAAGVDVGDRPLIVLTRGNPQTPPPGIAPAHAAAGDTAWLAGHTALARTSTRGSHIVVPNAGHHIQFDQPAAVIDAVRRVVADVRHGAAPADMGYPARKAR